MKTSRKSKLALAAVTPGVTGALVAADVFNADRPMLNLLLTILNKAGVQIDKLGDSTSPLDV